MQKPEEVGGNHLFFFLSHFSFFGCYCICVSVCAVCAVFASKIKFRRRRKFSRDFLTHPFRYFAVEKSRFFGVCCQQFNMSDFVRRLNES